MVADRLEEATGVSVGALVAAFARGDAEVCFDADGNLGDLCP